MKRRHVPLLERNARDVLHNARTWRELADGLTDVRLNDDELLHVFVVGGGVSVPDLLKDREVPGVRLVHASKELSLFSYTRRFGRKREHRVSGEFVVFRWEAEPVFCIVSCSPPKFVRLGLTPLFEGLYPYVARPFLSQAELQNLLRTVQKAVAPDQLRVQEFSAKRRLRSTHRRFESLRDWTDVDLESAFRESKERNVWFSSVKFAVVRRHGDQPGRWCGLHSRISKYGDVSVDIGFDLVCSVVLPQLISITTNRLKLFSNRDRVSTPSHALQPLEIAYDRALLKSTDDLKRLLDSLKRFPGGTCTVLHANPYLHVTLVDNIDFSAADVWVLSQSNILIVPQLSASYGALKRLVNHIFENFAEGKVGEAKIA